MGWRLLRRWDSRGDMGWPMLEAFSTEARRKDEEKQASTPRESAQSLRQAQDTAASSAFDFSQQSNNGRVTAAGAVAECAAPGLWLWGSAETGQWVAGHFGDAPADLHLTTPIGSVTVTGMGAGLLIWKNGKVTVEATGKPEVIVG